MWYRAWQRREPESIEFFALRVAVGCVRHKHGTQQQHRRRRIWTGCLCELQPDAEFHRCQEHSALRGLPATAMVLPPVKPLVSVPHVRVKSSVSLPVLHKPAGNLSRTGASQSRLDMLQRQFEHAGQSQAPLPRSERTRALNIAPPRSQHDHISPNVLVLDATDHPSDAPLLPKGYVAPSTEGGAFGSATNQLELRLAEKTVRRPQQDALLDAGSLDAASRGVAEECLAALRQLGAAVAPVLAPTLHRIADSLEPILLTTAHTSDDGRPLTYEQVCRTVLRPALADAEAREEEAVMEARSARSLLKRESERVTELRSQLANTGPQMLTLEARRSALEIELSGCRRENADLAEENAELKDLSEGVCSPRPQTP